MARQLSPEAQARLAAARAVAQGKPLSCHGKIVIQFVEYGSLLRLFSLHGGSGSRCHQVDIPCFGAQFHLFPSPVSAEIALTSARGKRA